MFKLSWACFAERGKIPLAKPNGLLLSRAKLAHKESVQLLIYAAKKRYRREKLILGWWVGSARSALCAKGCESRACSLGSVTVEDTSVTVEEFAADINGCCTYLRSEV